MLAPEVGLAVATAATVPNAVEDTAELAAAEDATPAELVAIMLAEDAETVAGLENQNCVRICMEGQKLKRRAENTYIVVCGAIKGTVLEEAAYNPELTHAVEVPGKIVTGAE